MTKNQAPSTKNYFSYWLLLGVTALAIAGLFSLVLVIARTPGLSEMPFVNWFFHEALAVHVDLSVLVWFLSIACLMWSLLTAGSPSIIPCLEEAALASFALGTVAIAASPIDQKGEALMSNYIPVITSPVFFLGLALLLCGVGLMLVKVFPPLPPGEGRGEGVAARIVPHPNPLPEGEGIRFAILSSAFIAFMAIIAFCWSFRLMPKDMAPGEDGVQYYEMLFWGGGHVLQFLHTQVLLICWLLVASSLRGAGGDAAIQAKNSGLLRYARNDGIILCIFCIGPLVALATPLIYLFYPVDSPEHREFFTQTMIWAGGIAPTLLAFYIIAVLWQARKGKNALWATLAMSVLLFIYGGILGEIIRGQNVVIPAHYHGSIVGITLAFMGAAYLLLPQFGYKVVSGWKMAFWQPVVYGGGQMLHISGLAWSGGYGVLRKTPGGMDALSPGVKAAMGLMGLGGMIAIIGGFMFVIVVWKAVRRKNSQQ